MHNEKISRDIMKLYETVTAPMPNDIDVPVSPEAKQQSVSTNTDKEHLVKFIEILKKDLDSWQNCRTPKDMWGLAKDIRRMANVVATDLEKIATETFKRGTEGL